MPIRTEAQVILAIKQEFPKVTTFVPTNSILAEFSQVLIAAPYASLDQAEYITEVNRYIELQRIARGWVKAPTAPPDPVTPGPLFPARTQTAVGTVVRSEFPKITTYIPTLAVLNPLITLFMGQQYVFLGIEDFRIQVHNKILSEAKLKGWPLVGGTVPTPIPGTDPGPPPPPPPTTPPPPPTAPPPAGLPDPMVNPAEVLVAPTITASSKQQNVLMTRTIGSYAPGWVATAGRWTNNLGAVIGNQDTCIGDVPIGGWALYRETISKPGEVDKFAWSLHFGPFVASTTPAPGPVPPTAPPPPPPSGGLMTQAQIDLAINMSSGNGNNDGHISPFSANWVYSWRGGSDWGFGKIFRKRETPHNMDGYNTTGREGFNDDSWNSFMEMWFVFMHERNRRGGIGHMDVRNVSFQVRDKRDGKWYFVWRGDNTIGWAPNWQMTAGGGQGYADGGGDASVIHRAGQYDTVIIRANGAAADKSHACHFSMSSAGTRIPMGAENIDGFCLAGQVRRGAGSEGGHTGLVHMGLDPKFKLGTGDSALWWTGGAYPNAGITRTIRLYDYWRDMILMPCHTTGIRHMTQQEIRNNPPFNPF